MMRLDAHAAGRAYELELARDPAIRKARGAFYTPKFLVDYLVQHTLGPWLEGKTPRDVKDLRIHDPTCGGGAFLLGAMEYLVQWYRRFDEPADPARHVSGTDIDAKAVRIARRSLNIKNIRVADALREPITPSFDIILTNPPYLNGVEARSRLDVSTSSELRSRFSCARGTVDLSILFQELCVRLLRPGGRCGLVVPNKFLSAPFGAAFREFAARETQLKLIADFSQAEVFPGTAVYPVSYVLAKDRTASPVHVETFYRAAARRGVPLTTCVCQASPAEVETWDQLFSPGVNLLQRLRHEFRPLGDVCEVAASATTAEAYAIRDYLTDTTARGFQFVTSGAVDRYSHHHGLRPLRYLKRTYIEPFLCADSLSDNRRRQYTSEKLIVAGMSRRLKVVWDNGRLAGAVSTVQILAGDRPVNLKVLLAILNSTLIDWWFHQTFGSLALSGGYLRIGSPQISAIPIWPRDSRRVAELEPQLASAADEIIRGIGEHRDVSALEVRIDSLVSDWFAMTLSEAELTLSSRTRKP